MSIKGLTLAGVLLSSLAMTACASKNDLDSLRLDVQKAQQSAAESAAAAQKAAADARAAADEARMASEKSDKVYSRSLRK